MHVVDLLPIQEVFLHAIHLKERGVAAGHTLVVTIVDTNTPVRPNDVNSGGLIPGSRSPSYNSSPVRRRDHSHSPTYHRYYSPDERYYRRHHRSSPETPDDYKYRRSRSRCHSRSISPAHGRYERSYSRSISPRHSRRSYSHSISPRRSVSPKYIEGTTVEVFPMVTAALPEAILGVLVPIQPLNLGKSLSFLVFRYHHLMASVKKLLCKPLLYFVFLFGMSL